MIPLGMDTTVSKTIKVILFHMILSDYRRPKFDYKSKYSAITLPIS
jgi:hypothetical protein